MPLALCRYFCVISRQSWSSGRIRKGRVRGTARAEFAVGPGRPRALTAAPGSMSRERGGSEACGNEERPPHNFCVYLIGVRAVQAILSVEIWPLSYGYYRLDGSRSPCRPEL